MFHSFSRLFKCIVRYRGKCEDMSSEKWFSDNCSYNSGFDSLSRMFTFEFNRIIHVIIHLFFNISSEVWTAAVISLLSVCSSCLFPFYSLFQPHLRHIYITDIVDIVQLQYAIFMKTKGKVSVPVWLQYYWPLNLMCSISITMN